MSELSELIEIAKNIEKQNTEIIRLLKKIAGEDDEEEKLKKYQELLSYSPNLGELYLTNDKNEEKKKANELKETKNKFQIGTLLENPHKIGEVYFIEDNDIFRLSFNENETALDNLTGTKEANSFDLQELVAKESLKNNTSLEDGTVILNSDQSQNLAETLRICVEQGAKKVYIPIFASAQLVSAPQNLMEILKLDFYRTEEGLIEKIFN